LLLAGALLFDEKKTAKGLHCFGLDCGMLEFFKYSGLLSCVLGDGFSGKDCRLCPFNPSAKEVGGLEVFLYEAAQNLELFQIFKIKIKNQKPIAADVVSRRIVTSGITLGLI
jgi:hypothetical protein